MKTSRTESAESQQEQEYKYKNKKMRKGGKNIRHPLNSNPAQDS